VKRLKLLAETTGAPIPSAEVLKRLATALSGFTEKAIDTACFSLEAAPPAEYRRLPTPHELTVACQNAIYVEVKQSRWCGRCQMGMIRGSDGQIRRCECACATCDNSGWTTEVQAVQRMPYKEARFALRCPQGCRVTGSEAA
jgi:hypothetical protein